MATDDVTLHLSRQRAIVLFEWLASSDGRLPSIVQHPSEEQVLLGLLRQLEKALTEPFCPDYPTVLSSARSSVVKGG